jgi:hypothetical protein
VDAAIGRTAEETAKFLWRHRIGTAHTVGTLGALTGAVLVTDNLLNLNISERMTDLAYAATGQAVSGKAGTGSAKGLLAGSGLVAGGMFANLQGMVMSASRDSRERSEREAGLGIFGDYDEVTYETVPTEVEADTTTPVAVAPEVAVAALEEETVKLPVVPSSTPESAAQSLSFTWFNASGATRELELVGANNA